MANHVWLKAEKYAANALELLKRKVRAVALFPNKMTKADFIGAKDDTVMVRRPAVLKAREKQWRGNDAIVVDRIVKTKIDVKLDKHPYSAIALSSEEATLDEVSYVRDIQVPQIDSILEYFEDAVVGQLATGAYVHEVDFQPGAAGYAGDPRRVALRARKHFQDSHVPTNGRYWLVGSSVSEVIAGHPKLMDVNTSGLPEALREGVVGRLGGFTIIELESLAEDESYFVHNTALVLAIVAPAVPQGAAKGATIARNGVAVTQVWDYDGDHLSDRSVVHAFVGAGRVLDPQTDEDGQLVLDAEDNPTLQFVRAIKVNFTPGDYDDGGAEGDGAEGDGAEGDGETP